MATCLLSLFRCHITLKPSRCAFYITRSSSSFSPSHVDSVRHHRISRRMGVRASTLFEVVSDVEKYSLFVPYVAKSHVLAPSECFPSELRSKVGFKPSLMMPPLPSLPQQRVYKKTFQATLDVGFTKLSTLSDAYTSLVTCRKTDSDEGVLQYSVHAEDLGDSSYFYGLGSLWTIRPHGLLESDVEFSCWYVPRSSSVLNRGVEVVIDGSYEMVSRQQMDAF
eukprot:CAMPEP_0118641806 /NCGR_PEP_ID=MMETSP0785-20121206/5498_1 /TAXON_ID=91992 /ORGANISM="Bolidomonas pacifica, Strain CCMP 1866" /LENGTH=221 /DNA_ID=CAMNT_0006533315 /DNA_START=216 /DNA_END=878 /DNA_ORIENTATION=-